jgi:hypothetical protein
MSDWLDDLGEIHAANEKLGPIKDAAVFYFGEGYRVAKEEFESRFSQTFSERADLSVMLNYLIKQGSLKLEVSKRGILKTRWERPGKRVKLSRARSVRAALRKL